jgi:hypothetical protein
MYSPTAEIFKWRLNEESGVILRSNADYLMVPVEMGYYRQSVGLIKSTSFSSSFYK